ncbi:hypothetical protein Ait01nite_014550 [Actinoplanes italicus]|uniref:Uncharacterized protein n=1 Tax=Actinoplanes italicus TaxID=113567 RepID=A0A2T0KHI7_9ACTN|nr:hypothetical protein [Actinoplanes italicus]PRX22888.1 hypothetical protein CLV67_104416 [Actinoplanes italicus]GIE28410.1 hypothetical protein Ait01nite_014550 [Actinoplanes italicus]
MQPIDQFGTATPTESSPVTRVDAGMIVVDSAGDDAGKVSAVQAPGTNVRPDTAAGVAEVLMGTGYLRIDGTGALSNDTYASGEQIADIAGGEPGTVRLNVRRDELHRATS